MQTNPINFCGSLAEKLFYDGDVLCGFETGLSWWDYNGLHPTKMIYCWRLLKK
jgi:hypothetical protein